MRALLLFFLCLLPAACGRPLTPTERAFAADIHGSSLDASRVRLHRGALIGDITWLRPARPRTTCRERILPPLPAGEPETVGAAAVTLFDHVFMRKRLWSPDYMPDYPERVNLLAAMLLSHELAHVWQWQNRARTGYHPLRAAAEHGASPDPYLFELETRAEFSDFAYEQQASIVEEYVCCRVLDPEAPRTRRLHRMLAQVMPVSDIDGRLARARITVPWEGAEREGICR